MTREIKYCEIHDGKICDNCNECNICDLDPSKLCDSCGKCLDLEVEKDYAELNIDGVFDEECEAAEYISEVDPLNPSYDENDEAQEFEYEFIEDIPELKKEYDEKIYEILFGKKKEHKHNHDHV